MDLTKPLPEPLTGNDYVRRARAGEGPAVAVAPPEPSKPKFKLMVPREINQLNMKPRKL